MTIENRIFLAHASEDKLQVRQLYNHLKASGLNPWLDVVDLVPGQNWEDEIPNVIRNATICLICLSKNSVSKIGYVQNEFRHALLAVAKRPAGSIYLIPARLEECEVPDLQHHELGVGLRAFHWVDLFENDGYDKLVEAIKLAVKPDVNEGVKAQGRTYSKLEDFEHQTKQPEPLSEMELEPFKVFKDINAPWCPEMIMLPAGKFLMGSPETEEGRSNDEGPRHEVTISQPFAIGRFVVTEGQFEHFQNKVLRDKEILDRDIMERLKARKDYPATVIYEHAAAYCAWLSKITNVCYRLPTEAMWEYACRAGTVTAYSFGDEITLQHANYDASRRSMERRNREEVEVGCYPANSWGLHDMHGNVREWVADWYGRYRGRAYLQIDPQGPRRGTERVARGGCNRDGPRSLRSAARSKFELLKAKNEGYNYRMGFRCARVPMQSDYREEQPEDHKQSSVRLFDRMRGIFASRKDR